MLGAKTITLFLLTAFAEILGCFLVYLWARQSRSAWLLIPAAVSLSAFAWLLTLHPFEAGRTYAAYGGIYIGAAILWLWFVEGVRPDRWDIAGSIIALIGMSIIVFAPRQGP